jgi:hypothetical protein
MEQRLPPQPMPENLWGETWRFAAILASDLPDLYADRPIPYQSVPEDRSPLSLGLASNILVPGVVIVGGKRSRALSAWLQSVNPVLLQPMTGSPDGLILHAGERSRWILATHTDEEMKRAGAQFLEQQRSALGLHFLLVQPDDTGMTYTGIWLMQSKPDTP